MNPSPSQTLPKRRSKSIQERILALQSSGCCLDNDTNVQSTSQHGASKSSLNDSISSLDLSTVTQKPLTPADNYEKNQRSVVSFGEMTNVCVIPQLDETIDYNDLFYNDEEIADFRHEAFLEKCGLADMF